MSLHSVVVVGRYQESGQDRSVLGSAWENEIKVGTLEEINEII